MARSSSYEQTPFLLTSQRLVGLLFLLALANGVFLYFLPWLARDWYAWPITPQINAASMGAGYLAGMLATGLGVFAVRHWRSVRVLIGPFAVLGLSLFVATMLHAERFRWDYAPTWVWTGVYFFLPIGSILIWLWQERAGSRLPWLDSRLAGVRLGSLVLGLPLLLASLWLYLSPQSFLAVWAWGMTPLLGRVFAGWYLFASLLLIFSGLMLRQAHEAPITFATLALWNLLLLCLPLLYASSVRFGTPGFAVWAGVHVLLLVFTAWVGAYTWRLMRAEGQQL